MQSDIFLHSTDSDDENSEYTSDSSSELPSNNNIGSIYDFPTKKIQNERFIDQSKQANYLNLRNELFTPELIKGRIVFYNYNSSDGVESYKHSLDLVNQYKLNGINNVIGFELITANVFLDSATHTEISDRIPFIDVIIPELPHITCKQNEYGLPIISRLKTNFSHNSSDHYVETDIEGSYNNYFTPISLTKLSFKLFDTKGNLITTNYPKINFEFELTILNRSLSKR